MQSEERFGMAEESDVLCQTYILPRRHPIVHRLCQLGICAPPNICTVQPPRRAQSSRIEEGVWFGQINPTHIVLQHAHLNPIEYRFNVKLYVLVYRCLHNLASPLLRNIFVLRVDATHTAAVTRGQTTSMLALPTVKSRFGYHSIAYLAADRWHSLPSHCRQCESSAHFIHTIKSLLGYLVIS